MTISSPNTATCTKTFRTSCWLTSNCLNSSRHPYTKQPRIDAADRVSRVACALDATERPFLVAGDKSGVSEKRFYHQLIDLADERFEAHAAKVKKRKEKQKKELR